MIMGSEVNMGEWISVKDRLPDRDDYNDYLITDGRRCFVGHYRHNADAWDNYTLGWVQEYYADGSVKDIEITHWRELPELPKEGNH